YRGAISSGSDLGGRRRKLSGGSGRSVQMGAAGGGKQRHLGQPGRGPEGAARQGGGTRPAGRGREAADRLEGGARSERSGTRAAASASSAAAGSSHQERRNGMSGVAVSDTPLHRAVSRSSRDAGGAAAAAAAGGAAAGARCPPWRAQRGDGPVRLRVLAE